MDEIQNYTLKDQPLSLPLHDRTRPLAESNKPRLALSQEEHPEGTRDRHQRTSKLPPCSPSSTRNLPFPEEFSGERVHLRTQSRRLAASPGRSFIRQNNPPFVSADLDFVVSL